MPQKEKCARQYKIELAAVMSTQSHTVMSQNDYCMRAFGEGAGCRLVHSLFLRFLYSL